MKSLAFAVLLAAACQTSVSTTPDPENGSMETKMVSARQKWIKLDKDLKYYASTIIRRAMPVLMKEIYKKEISASCMGSLMTFAQALRQSKLWAYKMLDSSGKFPEGFLQGTLTSLGNYEECIGINVNETKVKVQGQYCTINLLPPLPIWKPFTSAHLLQPELINISSPDSVITHLMGLIHNLHIIGIKIGICTPSKCSVEDLNKLVEIVPEQLDISWKAEVNRCETKTPLQFTNAQFIVLYIMGVMALLVFIGTVADKVWSSKEMEISSLKSTLFHVIKAFSFTSNAKKLSDFTSPYPELSFFYGIIVFFYCWNVLANTFMYVNYDVAASFLDALKLLQHLFYEMVLNRIMPLQALLYISGFLTTYSYLKSTDEGFNVVRHLVKRFWRYTPTYVLVICLILITPTWGSGPMWNMYMDPMYKRCKDNWWYNVLYINNFGDPNAMCLDHTWLFAVLAQLHIIALFILVPLKLRPKVGLVVNFTIALGSLVTVALTNVYYDLPPNEMTAILHPKDRIFYAVHSYYRVYTHLCLYCTGIFVAYLMAKHPNIKISTGMSCFLWIATATGVFSALFSVHVWRQGEKPSPLEAAVYATFSKIAESAFLAWITVAFMTGHSGGAKDVFGWRPFAFFARLTFIAYILHVPIMEMVMNFKRAHVFVCELEIFYIFLSHLIGSYLIAYALHMFFEAPMLSLTDVLCRRCKGRTFTRRESLKEPMTEKHMKYSQTVTEKSKICSNAMEKGTT